jgi:hypothetical protein
MFDDKRTVKKMANVNRSCYIYTPKLYYPKVKYSITLSVNVKKYAIFLRMLLFYGIVRQLNSNITPHYLRSGAIIPPRRREWSKWLTEEEQ